MQLSILIPSRNELFLKNTIEDILSKIEADTEIIAVLDGAWADPPIKDDSRVNLVYLNEAIGQRAAQNTACRLSKAKYVMKVDAHCSFDQGFDRKMIEAFKETGDNVTMVPTMMNLYAFDWKCYHCGKKVYQDKPHTVCPQCGKSGNMRRKMIWQPKKRTRNMSYRFNSDLEFKYFSDYRKRQVGDIVETMSLQGSCFMATRENYWAKELCDETWGSWGGQGAEVAIKTWLSGGRVLVNTRTWYAHMFRTKSENNFGFPYPNPALEQLKAKNKLREVFLNNKWPKAIHNIEWLVDKFSPVPGWEK